MTIKDYLAKNFPDVKTVWVEIREFCNEDHPPKLVQWEYNESYVTERETGEMYHDATTMRTARFSTTDPVLSCIRAGKEEHSGKLSPYHTGSGKTVTRSYKVRITRTPYSLILNGKVLAGIDQVDTIKNGDEFPTLIFATTVGLDVGQQYDLRRNEDKNSIPLQLERVAADSDRPGVQIYSGKALVQ